MAAKRITALFTALVALFASLTCLSSCNRSYDEEEIKNEALLLIASSISLNEIYWGRGIEYVEDTSSASGAYYPANPLSLARYGFGTIDGLRKLTRSVFSEKYCENIFSTRLSSITDESGIRVYARYYQKYSDADEKEPECIMVYKDADVFLIDEVEYLYETLKVKGSKKDTVYVELTVRVTRGEKVQERTIEVGLVEEENGWRISTPTYMVYNEKIEEYENLTKDK